MLPAGLYSSLYLVYRKRAPANKLEGCGGNEEVEERKMVSSRLRKTSAPFKKYVTSEGLVENRVRTPAAVTELYISVEKLILLDGNINPEQILKDDGCNTNDVSKSLLNQNIYHLNVTNTSTVISNSKPGTGEEINQVILDAELEAGGQQYISRSFVGDYRFEVMFRIQWH